MRAYLLPAGRDFKWRVSTPLLLVVPEAPGPAGWVTVVLLPHRGPPPPSPVIYLLARQGLQAWLLGAAEVSPRVPDRAVATRAATSAVHDRYQVLGLLRPHDYMLLEQRHRDLGLPPGRGREPANGGSLEEAPKGLARLRRVLDAAPMVG
jgi:hypothetical protein